MTASAVPPDRFPIVASIRYPRDERLVRLFAAEERDMGRARYDVVLADDAVVFTITAHDATALRAAASTITKVLSAWEASSTDGRPH